MKSIFFSLVSFMIFLNSIAFAGSDIHIIPEPYELERKAGFFVLNASTKIKYNDPKIEELIKTFQQELGNVTGYALPISKTALIKGKNLIYFEIEENNLTNSLGNEGYELHVSKGVIRLKANTSHGLFNAIQSFNQLLPKEIEDQEVINRKGINLPCVAVVDYPRFEWRGLMLDVSRHFFSKEFIKRYLDQMAKYKLNIFHWHLTDDNGWRIEIKGLPKLTEVGAWRALRKGPWATLAPEEGEAQDYGGYYTQEDIKEIVKYAQERYITIVPEIDVPGHSLAMIAAYPWLSCTGEQFMINNGRGFGNESNVLCVSNESVYELLDTVFTQVAQLFPGEYIHVGADEVNFDYWNKHEKCKQLMGEQGIQTGNELQNYFEKRIEKMIHSKGKKMTAWYGDYMEGLSPETAVYSWQGNAAGIKSSQEGRNVVMTPDWETYLDFYQGNPSSEPFSIIGGIVRLKHCYQFDIVPQGANEEFILGGQGNLWTESVPNERHAEYMTWPRAFALAEVFWSSKSNLHWERFLDKVESHLDRLSLAKVNFATSFKDAIVTGIHQESTDEWLVKLDAEYLDATIYYNFDGTVADEFSLLYEKEPLRIPKGATHIRAITYRNGKLLGEEVVFPLSELKNPLLR